MTAPSDAITLGVDLGGPRGILMCGTGVGVAVAANKLPGIRAGLFHDTYSDHHGVEHDNINVLVLGGKGHRQGTRPGAGRVIFRRPLHLPGEPPPPTPQDPIDRSPLRSDYEGNSEP